MNVTLDFDEKNLIHTLAIASIHDSYKILAVSSSRKEKKKNSWLCHYSLPAMW